MDPDAPAPEATPQRLLRVVAEALEDKKADDLLLLDLRGLSPITDFTLIATGYSQPHLKALNDAVERGVKTRLRTGVFRRAGTPESEWMALDYVDVVVHIFSAETRQYYDLEGLWRDAPRIALEELGSDLPPAPVPPVETGEEA